MKSMKWFPLSLVAFAFAILLGGCSGNSTVIQPPPPVVTLGTTPATVQPGSTAQFSATVRSDSSNLGVNWTVACPAPPCGSVSPATTPTGVPTTYTAPVTPPAGDLTVTVTATAAAGGSIPASASFQVPGITVNVPPPGVTSLVANGTVQLTANVTGDAAGKGVAWTVTCGLAACGSVSPTTTASGVSTTYTAPAIPPASDTIVTITAASVTNSAASGSATVTILGITLSIAPTSANVESAGTQQFTAMVGNDPGNGGVRWSLEYSTTSCRFSCTTTFHSCGSICGSVSPTATASGAPMTFNAPNIPPHIVGLLPRGPYVVATSVTNISAFRRELITVLAIGISVSPTPSTVALNAVQPLTATVTNDAANAGVTWTLKQAGIVCSPGCGTISSATTASGAPTSYTAPVAVPAYPILTAIATSVTDPSKSGSAAITVTTPSGSTCGAGSGSELLLKGQYAFQMQTVGQGTGTITGSFSADGMGKITGGVEEINGIQGQIDATKSLYGVGPDHRGCMTFDGGTYFRFALGAIKSTIATSGHIIEFDDTTGTGSRHAGTFKLQDITSFAAGKFNGTYAFGLSGGNAVAGRIAVAGIFTSDGISAISTSNLDIDNAGTLTTNLLSAPGGSFTCCDANGRGTLQLSGLANVLSLYMISSSEAFLVGSLPNYNGEAIAVPGGTMFTQTSLNGAAVIRKTAASGAGPIVDVALATTSGTSGVNITNNTNSAGTFISGTTPFTYTVASNGRVTLVGGTATPPVIYLYSQNAGFLVGSDATVEFGIIEPQAAGPFTTNLLSGAYMFGTENPSAINVTLESGVATLDGSGNVGGTSDQSSSAGLAQNQTLSSTYSVAPDGTGTFGSGTTAIFISVSKLVFIDNTSAAPTITVVEK